MAERYRDTRAALPAGTLTLPARFYTDPEQLRRELETIHYRTWLCAGREEELPGAGSYVLRRVGEASVVLVRNEAGKVAAFHNVCRHRGSILCKEESGRLPGRIRCSYHGWSYGLDGRLLGAPHMEKVEGGSGKGSIVLATVKGDVHDIGKNLVDIILTNNGYEVHNLGIKVSVTEMIDKALEVKADAIGMSGLLVAATSWRPRRALRPASVP